MNHFYIQVPFKVILLTSLLLASIVVVSASTSIGGRPTERVETQAVTSQSLSQLVHEFGRITLSVDALGTVEDSGTIQVDKPAGATVRKAYLMSTTRGFTSKRLNTGEVKIEGNSFIWEQEVANSIASYNYWTEVTAIIKSAIDTAPAGLVNLTISEAGSSDIDGEILAVIFDDPNQTVDNSILLYFGAQNVDGDSFNLDFGASIDKENENLILDYSLGISHGHQTWSLTNQYNEVNVNGVRLTSSAGGHDDGTPANGGLMTVGGIGDSNTNPTDSHAHPANFDTDDELYSLLPYVDDEATSVTVTTMNSSGDDNILFAALTMGATRSVPAVDVDISLYSNPTTIAERAPYENIISYMADAIFEASNGAHKIGRVTFHTSNTNSHQADIIWTARCHPNANISGARANGLHVNMCDSFANGLGTGRDYEFMADDAHQKGGGYTLAHEWGHYYYSLYDEYVGNVSYDHIFYFPHSTDVGVTHSIMNSQWRATGGNYNWLNFSVPKNDTQQTAQYRVYQASGWETLARPVSEDPRDSERRALPPRLYYPELADVAPHHDEDAPLDLPGNARDALNIVWEVPTRATAPTELPFTAQLNSISGQNISYPDPLLLIAYVHKDLTIIDLGIQASVRLPDNSTIPITFADDGIAPDVEANDGLYSALVGYQSGGIYTVQAQFNNNSYQAKYVANAFQPAHDANGTSLALPEPEPVNENFNISKSIEIVVSNIAADDHEDTPASASTVAANNRVTQGKIDRASDKDVFQFETLNEGITFVRITGLALDMNPRLRILASDRWTVLRDVTLDDIAHDYLSIPLPGIPAGTTVYAEVSHQDGLAIGGLYELSVGERLASDAYFGQVFIPIVIH